MDFGLEKWKNQKYYLRKVQLTPKKYCVDEALFQIFISIE